MDNGKCKKCSTSLNAWPNHTETTCPACLTRERIAREAEHNKTLQDIGRIMVNNLRPLTRQEIYDGVKLLAWELKMKRDKWRKIGAGWEHTTAVLSNGKFLTVDEATAQQHYEAGTTPPPF